MNLRRSLLIGSLVLLVGAPAWAYLLPGWSLVRKAEAKREEYAVRSLQVQGTVTLTGDAAKAAATKLKLNLEGDSLTVPAVASYKSPGRCRVELTPPGAASVSGPGGAEGARPFVSYRNGALAGDADLKPLRALLALTCPLLTSRGGDEGTRVTSEWLKALGVDLGTVSLGRFSGGIAEVVGAGPRDESAPQLWVDKDSFFALRVIAKAQGTLQDARLLELGGPASGGEGLPRALELWPAPQGGATAPLVRFEGEKADPAAKLDDKLFGG